MFIVSVKDDDVKLPKKSKPRWWLVVLIIIFFWAAILVWFCVGLSKSTKSSIERRNKRNSHGKYGSNNASRRY